MFNSISKNLKNNFKNLLSKTFLAFCITISIVSSVLSSVPVVAQGYTAPCTIKVVEVKIWSIGNPGNFFPIIPEECGTYKSSGAGYEAGDIMALPIVLLFDVMLRGFGLMFSFFFYALPIAVIVLGFRFLLISYDPELNKTQFTEITTLARTISKTSSQFLIAIVMVVFAYTFVFSILNILGISSPNTNIKSFFRFG